MNFELPDKLGALRFFRQPIRFDTGLSFGLLTLWGGPIFGGDACYGLSVCTLAVELWLQKGQP